MVLPHLLRSKTYTDFYRNIPGFKILDNGEAENVRDKFTDIDLLTLGLAIGADEIVVPDVIRHCDLTIQKAHQFWDVLGKFENRFKFMGVVQGRSHAELMKCLNGLVYTDYISSLGIPRHLPETIGDKSIRIWLAEFINEEFPGYDIHFLGAHSFVKEALLAAELGFVRGMDTSAPVVIGLERMDIRTAYYGRQSGFFKLDADELQHKWIDHNVSTFIDWCSDTQTP